MSTSIIVTGIQNAVWLTRLALARHRRRGENLVGGSSSLDLWDLRRLKEAREQMGLLIARLQFEAGAEMVPADPPLSELASHSVCELIRKDWGIETVGQFLQPLPSSTFERALSAGVLAWVPVANTNLPADHIRKLCSARVPREVHLDFLRLVVPPGGAVRI